MVCVFSVLSLCLIAYITHSCADSLDRMLADRFTLCIAKGLDWWDLLASMTAIEDYWGVLVCLDHNFQELEWRERQFYDMQFTSLKCSIYEQHLDNALVQFINCHAWAYLRFIDNSLDSLLAEPRAISSQPGRTTPERLDLESPEGT